MKELKTTMIKILLGMCSISIICFFTACTNNKNSKEVEKQNTEEVNEPTEEELAAMKAEEEAKLAEEKAKVEEEAKKLIEEGNNYVFQSIYNGEEINYEMAMQKYTEALELGYEDANYYLGMMYDYATYPSRDYEKAFEYYKKNESNPDSMIALSMMYVDGDGVDKNIDMAKEYMNKALDNGYVDANYAKSIISVEENNWDEVVEAAKKTVSEGKNPRWKSNSYAVLAYYYMNKDEEYINTNGHPQYDLITENNNKALDYGNMTALDNYGMWTKDGLLGQPANLDEAIEIYKIGAELGNIPVMYSLASAYKQANNGASAVDIYEKLIERGEAKALTILGFMYEQGDNIDIDYTKAVDCFQKATEKNEIDAIYNLAYMYQHGMGVDTDILKSIELYEKAAELGDGWSAKEIGLIYMNGEGVEQDNKKAFDYFMKGVELGDASSMNNVGVMYYKGSGVDRDVNKAIEYLEMAIENGNDSAKQSLDAIKANEGF